MLLVLRREERLEQRRRHVLKRVEFADGNGTGGEVEERPGGRPGDQSVKADATQDGVSALLCATSERESDALRILRSPKMRPSKMRRNGTNNQIERPSLVAQLRRLAPKPKEVLTEGVSPLH